VTLCLKMGHQIECFSARESEELQVGEDYSVRNFVIRTSGCIFLEFRINDDDCVAM
jgi:hypothetical protein